MVEQIDNVLLPRDIDIVGKEGEDPADDLGLHIYETSTRILRNLHPGPPAGGLPQRPRENYPPGDCSCGGGQAAALNFSCSLMVLELV